MKIRAAADVNGQSRQLSLFSVLQETTDHLVLKLAGLLFFFKENLMVISNPQQHAALAGQDFAPDLLAADEAGQVRLWIECGKTTQHKLDKVSKRFRDARILLLTTQPREGQNVADMLAEAGLTRIEVWSFREGEFARWRGLVRENNSIFGEATPTELNLVINDEAFMTTLVRVPPV